MQYFDANLVNLILNIKNTETENRGYFMKYFILPFLFLGFSIACVVDANAQSAPKYSNEFLSLGVGARALGMSNSYVAAVNDVTAGYWNPAGLLEIKNNLQVALMHSEYFAGIAKYDYGAVAARINPESVAAFSVIRFGVDDIPNTTELIDANGNIDYDRITSFSATDYGFIFSYARKPKVEGLRYGASAKVVYRNVGEFANAWGFGLDAGVQFDRGTWRFAAMGRDITSTFNAWSFSLDDRTKEVFQLTGNEIPSNSLEVTLPKVILATGKLFKIGDKFSIYPELDLDLTFDGKRNVLIKGDPISIEPHFGTEFTYSDFIFVRGGIGNFQQVTDFDGEKNFTFQPNIGVGIRIKNFRIDYALTDIGDNSIALFSNVFSLRFDLNKKEK